MKYKKIILFFCIALPLSVIMRLLQLMYTIDTATGFFKQEFEGIGYYLLIVIAAFAFVTGILAMTSHRNPETPPKPNIFISLSSAALAISILYEIFAEKYPAPVRAWQSSLLIICGIFASLYFMIYAIKPLINLNTPNLLSVIPSVYFIMRIICTFTSISSLALITDNLILIASYCTTLLFMLSFAKLFNSIDTEKNFRRLLAYGLSTVILCLTESLPHLIVNIITNNSYLHTSTSTNVSVLFTGLFIAAFTFSHFYMKRTHHVKRMSVSSVPAES